jgi:hypothetical protein
MIILQPLGYHQILSMNFHNKICQYINCLAILNLYECLHNSVYFKVDYVDLYWQYTQI